MSQIKGKKQIVKLTVDDQDILIELVRLHPAIYDASQRDHRDKNVTQNIWKKIAREMDVEGLDCK